MNKKCLISIAVLLSIILAGIYKFIFQGSVIEDRDNRTAILLDEAERNFVLAEMRTFLASVQQITEGVGLEDMAIVSQSARMVGNAAQQGAPGTLMGKLPIGFKQLGHDTHTRFDQLALDAEDLGDASHSLSQLSELMKNCVACHETYKIQLVTRQ